MNIKKLSNNYNVRKLEETDIQDIFNLCCKNELFYKYCPPFVTEESIKKDMISLPPNTGVENKFYVGFYKDKTLIAVLNLICGYPKENMAFIGFFMTNKNMQNKGIGSEIISELCDYLKHEKFVFVRLAWAKENPQAEHFWIKNKFTALKETKTLDNAPYIVLLAERKL